MRAFIVRPFGQKQGIDFDRVQQELIDPALKDADITGDTTAEIIEAGNIRADMFQLLLTADLVVADVSIDNANVFYELGIRHALRAHRTVLIRASGMATIPFDLRTDRYFEYKLDNPAGSLNAIAAALRQIRTSERVDSPVFTMLPELREQSRSRLLPVPREFREEAELAAANRQPGRLGLLGREAAGFLWESEAFRLVGRSLFRMKAFSGARRIWERVRDVEPADTEANLLLGTIYQRQGELAASDLALDRVLQNDDSTDEDRAEALALRGRNDKSRLIEAWTANTPEERQRNALRSRYLLSSYGSYRRAFLHDLNHYYSGLNALALVTIATELIDRHSDVWSEQFDTAAEAAFEKSRLQQEMADLASSVALSVEANEARLPKGKRDIWLDISVADHKFLTSKRPSRAADAYKRALEGADAFAVDSARAQLEMYRMLGVFTERIEASLAVFPSPAGSTVVPAKPLRRAVIFTGHMIDAPGRAEPRFPAEAEPIARDAIRNALAELCGTEPDSAMAFAGGASGGDILFHEACAELGVPAKFRLTLPPGPFKARSVAPADRDWTQRFDALVTRLEGSMEVLCQAEQLPSWLSRREGRYDVWQRTNLWLLEELLASGAPELHLLALWDGKPGDGPGGTQHLIETARQQGISTRILDTRTLFKL